jgi:hypothetical protein
MTIFNEQSETQMKSLDFKLTLFMIIAGLIGFVSTYIRVGI